MNLLDSIHDCSHCTIIGKTCYFAQILITSIAPISQVDCSLHFPSKNILRHEDESDRLVRPTDLNISRAPNSRRHRRTAQQPAAAGLIIEPAYNKSPRISSHDSCRARAKHATQRSQWHLLWQFLSEHSRVYFLPLRGQ